MRPIASGILALLLLTAPLRADVNGLVTDLASKDPDVRRQAAKKLAEMEAQDVKSAFSALVKSLKDEDVFVRRFSAQALGAIGTEVKGTVPALTAALKDRDKRVIQAAVEALGKSGPDGVKPLAELLKDKKQEPNTRLKIVQALGNAGKCGCKSWIAEALADLRHLPFRQKNLCKALVLITVKGGVGHFRSVAPMPEEDR